MTFIGWAQIALVLAAIVAASKALGLLETQAGAGALVRDVSLFVGGIVGAGEQIFVQTGLPRV